MSSLNISDYKILNSIVDEETGVGMSRLRGVTILELSEISGFSTTKVRHSIKILINKGFVDYAAKRVRSDAFHITPLGVKELESIGKSVINIDDDNNN